MTANGIPIVRYINCFASENFTFSIPVFAEQSTTSDSDGTGITIICLYCYQKLKGNHYLMLWKIETYNIIVW